MERATGRRIVRVPITRSLAKLAIEKIPGVYQLLQIPSGTIDYLTQPTQYLTDHARADLGGTGTECPALTCFLPTLIDFMRSPPRGGLGGHGVTGVMAPPGRVLGHHPCTS